MENYKDEIELLHTQAVALRIQIKSLIDKVVAEPGGSGSVRRVRLWYLNRAAEKICDASVRINQAAIAEIF